MGMIFNFVYIVEAGRSVIAAARFYPPPYCRTEKTDSLLRKSSFAEFRPDKRSPPDTDISQQCCLRLLTFLDLAAAIGRQQVLQVVEGGDDVVTGARLEMHAVDVDAIRLPSDQRGAV